jgi:hypothetical protein
VVLGLDQCEFYGMDPLFWIKLGLAVFACLALYFVAWPLPNFLERVVKEHRSKRQGPADDAFLDYLAGEGERLDGKLAIRDDPTEVEQRIRAYAISQRLTRAEAVRRLVEVGLAAEETRGQREKLVEELRANRRETTRHA